jgi:hypothetical protein
VAQQAPAVHLWLDEKEEWKGFRVTVVIINIIIIEILSLEFRVKNFSDGIF